MKIKRLVMALGLLVGLFFAACKGQKPMVTPLAVDLPVSYKSDSAAYNFILRQVTVWNKFGKKIESMYLKGEKYRKKDFESLSERQLYKLLKFDYDYAARWLVQEQYLLSMSIEADLAMKGASLQGAAKIVETQRVVMDYYKNLVRRFGTDLNLDQKPFSQDSLVSHPASERDLLYQIRIDSLSTLLMPSSLPEELR